MGRSCGNCCEPLDPTCPSCLTCAGYQYTLCFDTRDPASGLGCSRREEEDPLIRLFNKRQTNFGMSQKTNILDVDGRKFVTQSVCPVFGQADQVLAPGTRAIDDTSSGTEGLNLRKGAAGPDPRSFAYATGMEWTDEMGRLWIAGTYVWLI